MIPREPFTHQCFRCPRCGSSRGIGCNCWQVGLQQKQELKVKLDLPKLDLPKGDLLDLNKPLKKPWEI